MSTGQNTVSVGEGDPRLLTADLQGLREALGGSYREKESWLQGLGLFDPHTPKSLYTAGNEAIPLGDARKVGVEPSGE